MDLLLLLAAHPGQVLGRERITAVLWPEVLVGDDSLARTVSKLRQALGDDAKSPRYIETLSKRGYRLLAPVSEAPVRAAGDMRPSVLARPGVLLVAALLGGLAVAAS
ncbi:winged helix-turn-helix domain-containing protein, partial [Lysobacter sp. D1-1-M9]|uniref:winged helix-turn-helix domain-containing protein n=1 Tax=Novilysobacter longmucuonensis TaxID=3098603 RepID=UPI002FCAA845